MKDMGIEIIECPGEEADDIIGTYAKFFSENNIESFLFTTDKDIAQLSQYPHVKTVMVKSKKEGSFKVIDSEEDVMEFLGVEAAKIPELFGLMGDKADAIPGVQGIGLKTGQKLINKYGILENLYLNINEQTGKLKERLIKEKENAFISRDLAIINTEIKIHKNLEELKWKGIKFSKIKATLTNLDMFTSISNIERILEQKDNKTDDVYNIMLLHEGVYNYGHIHYSDEWKIEMTEFPSNVCFLNNKEYNELTHRLQYKTLTSTTLIGIINIFLSNFNLNIQVKEVPLFFKGCSIKEMIKKINGKDKIILSKGKH